ncbi:MAG: hypothetical protein ACPG4U_04135 [Pseudomonadales bacterium]
MNTYSIPKVVQLDSTDNDALLQRLFWGNAILVATALWAVISIAIAFVFEAHFELGVQIAAHISIIACSLTLKVGYLLRSYALKGLGSLNF